MGSQAGPYSIHSRGGRGAVRAPMCPLTPCMTPLHHVPRTRRTEGARPLSSHDVTQIAFHYFFALPLPLPLPLPPPFLGVYEYVMILDEATYGGVNMRIQRDTAVRLRAEGDFVQRLKEVLKERKTWLMYSDIEAIMECPRGGSRAVQRAVQHAQHQGEPLAMERFNNQWYYGLRDENQALPPPPSLRLPLPF